MRESNHLYLPIGSETIRLQDRHLRAFIKTENGWQIRARFIVEQILNRKLEKWEEVHHKDFNTLNDDPYNLQVLLKGEHGALHSKLHWSNRSN